MESFDIQFRLNTPQGQLKETASHRLHHTKHAIDEEKVVGDLATIANMIMYVSYISQIIENLNGNPTPPIQPLCAAINAALWTWYGWVKPKRDWILIVADVPGVIFGVLTAVTAVI
ncbi:hypothetical protein FEZ41_10790 [Lentilactobacillus parafarraginis]|uniref:Small conserved membrane protein n=3 Tax=Lentilactobacillus parafarraginis TaxID=390842 RepID=A0A0R1YTE5_9LACO|nr:hypothetical protein HMPREF9103_02096 [Lentilactobacillus parafarraginis F0439]KRM42467.1 hypothetical protein FD47_GL001835 [Lentilactobacillus parafarraginis DSM 18390 = JCM 14109]TLQ17905.1 hypothetical protein FEZ41_10790 [Lentilactobacillus parafarraginis]